MFLSHISDKFRYLYITRIYKRTSMRQSHFVFSSTKHHEINT